MIKTLPQELSKLLGRGFLASAGALDSKKGTMCSGLSEEGKYQQSKRRWLHSAVCSSAAEVTTQQREAEDLGDGMETMFCAIKMFEFGHLKAICSPRVWYG